MASYNSPVMPCTCQNDGQDKLHGKGMRVHNTLQGAKKTTGTRQARCTVCLTVRDVRE